MLPTDPTQGHEWDVWFKTRIDASAPGQRWLCLGGHVGQNCPQPSTPFAQTCHPRASHIRGTPQPLQRRCFGASRGNPHLAHVGGVGLPSRRRPMLERTTVERGVLEWRTYSDRSYQQRPNRRRMGTSSSKFHRWIPRPPMITYATFFAHSSGCSSKLRASLRVGTTDSMAGGERLEFERWSRACCRPVCASLATSW